MRSTLALLLVLIECLASAVIIPTDRQINWGRSICGVPGGIPSRATRWCDVSVSIPGTGLTADTNGVLNSQPALNFALANCPSNQHIYLPPGTYRCKTNLTYVANNITLRGAGTNLTTILCDYAVYTLSTNPTTHVVTTNYGGDFIGFGAYNEQGTSRILTANLNIGETNATFDTVGAMDVGSMFKIWVNDCGTTFTATPGSADPLHWIGNGVDKGAAGAPLIRQVFMVTAISGTTVTFWPPSKFFFTNTLSKAQYFYQTETRLSGIEYLTIKGVGTVANNIHATQTYGCWLNNVLSRDVLKAHVYADYNLRFEIRNSRLSEAFNYTANAGVGLLAYGHNCDFLIENSIGYKNFPFIECNLGCNGWSILGCAAFEPQGGLAPYDLNHTPFNCFNLIEGCYGYGLLMDSFFGSSAYVTAARNWFTGDQPNFGSRKPVNLDRGSRYVSLENNVLGYSGTNWVNEIVTNGWNNAWAAIYRLGYPNMGNDNFSGTNTLGDARATNSAALDFYVSTNLITHGNYDFASHSTVYDDAITDRVFRVSYFADYNTTNTPAGYTNAAWPAYGADLGFFAMTSGNMAFNYFTGVNWGGTGAPAAPPVPESLFCCPR